MTLKSRIDTTQRKFLKNTLGVTRSCPTPAVYGETGELPISLKGYRLMLKYWHRVSNLPDYTLAKKALLENVQLRTNWIKTVEKILGKFDLTDKIDKASVFETSIKKELNTGFREYWKKSLAEQSLTRLKFYAKIKNTFEKETYLSEISFDERRNLTKLRCSDHRLEIEKGRHRGGKERSERICKFCPSNVIEDEEHFIFVCNR